jgi:hypothetical protein
MKYGLELYPDSGFAPVVRDVDSPPIPCGTAMIQKSGVNLPGMGTSTLYQLVTANDESNQRCLIPMSLLHP